MYIYYLFFVSDWLFICFLHFFLSIPPKSYQGTSKRWVRRSACYTNWSSDYHVVSPSTPWICGGMWGWRGNRSYCNLYACMTLSGVALLMIMGWNLTVLIAFLSFLSFLLSLLLSFSRVFKQDEWYNDVHYLSNSPFLLILLLSLLLLRLLPLPPLLLLLLLHLLLPLLQIPNSIYIIHRLTSYKWM